MSFVLEVVRNGKDIILFNNYKYRECYSLKSGDVVWRCLGKTCKASVKTDKHKTAIYFCNEVHTGPHPVTMRALASTPPQQSQRSRPTTPVAMSSPCPVVTASTPREDTTTPTCLPTAPTTPPTTASEDTRTAITASHSTEELVKENNILRQELIQLRRERVALLEHSVQSDQRLLEFTDDIFAVNSIPSKFDQASQTDALNLHNTPPCQKCIILEEEVRNMLTSIRCLEEETKQLKTSDYSNPCPISSEIVNPLILSNSFEPLNAIDEETTYPFTTVISKNNRKRSKQSKFYSTSKKPISSKPHTRKNQILVDTPFKNVLIAGDSHARHLAALVSETTSTHTKVTGVCKPGAGLLDIATRSTISPDCVVLIAGANDVAAGREDIILRNFEQVLHNTRQTSSILVCPLLPRHDLPGTSPVHGVVSAMNNYIAELCARFDEVELLDISGIRRCHYTTHGLHLRAGGKRLLSKCIVDGLASMPASKCHQNPSVVSTKPSNSKPSNSWLASSKPSSSTQPSLPAPYTLPFNTYSDAVIQGSTENNFNYNSNNQKNFCMPITLHTG